MTNPSAAFTSEPERYEAPAITSREPIRDPVIASVTYTTTTTSTITLCSAAR